ncbi:MAG: riboflavin synthase [Planctomycetota bacterium]|jgi:riboflavin synthase
MFTGIIEAVGELLSVEQRSRGYRLTVDLSALAKPGTPDPEPALPGDSIAVSGPCLTVAALEGSRASFDCVRETAERTTVPAWRAGRRLNLERSVAVGGRMGGHFVTGHVDGKSRVLAVREVGEGLEADFSIPAGCQLLVAAKGSVTLDGVSLTVARLLTESSFRVALVPHTLGETTLSGLRAGDEVNFEADVLARYAARLMGRDLDGGLTEDKLREAGFI